MNQRYNNNTKRPRPQDTQLGILKIYALCHTIQQRALVPRESAAGISYLSMRIHPKSCCIFLLRQSSPFDASDRTHTRPNSLMRLKNSPCHLGNLNEENERKNKNIKFNS